jgi:hypothetical protein
VISTIGMFAPDTSQVVLPFGSRRTPKSFDA